MGRCMTSEVFATGCPRTTSTPESEWMEQWWGVEAVRLPALGDASANRSSSSARLDAWSSTASS